MVIDLDKYVRNIEDLEAVNTRLCNLFERSPEKGVDEFTLKDYYIQILKGSMVDYINHEAKLRSILKNKNEFVLSEEVTSDDYVSEIERLIENVQDKGMRKLDLEDDLFNLLGGSNHNHERRMRAITRNAEYQTTELNDRIEKYRYFDNQIRDVLSGMATCVEVINESPIAADRVKKIFELRYKLAKHQQ